MKKYRLSINLDLTPSQVLNWNDILVYLKDTLLDGPKEAGKRFQQPPKEFVEKILSLEPLKEPEKSNLVKLNESFQESEVWVSPLEIARLLQKERVN